MSNVVIMDSMKHYFNYKFDITCGISEVHFLGTLEDWNKLLEKTKDLRIYNLPDDNTWKKYIDELIPILENFIKTYNGDKNKKFWNGIVYEEFGSNGYGFGKPEKLTGWLTKFFYGNNDYGNVDKIPILNTEVPVKLVINGKELDINIYAGFSGINEKDLVYRPQMSIFIK